MREIGYLYSWSLNKKVENIVTDRHNKGYEIAYEIFKIFRKHFIKNATFKM